MNTSLTSPRDLELNYAQISTSLPLSFRHRPASDLKVLVIFLHGYTDHGGSFLRRLFKDEPSDVFSRAALLAPNGPFPVPVKSETGWREAYAWYFYDDRDQKMVISPETAILGCEKLIQDFGYESVPKILVGFSQGGYLAGYLAPRIRNVVEIIGVATGFREDCYPAGAPWTVTAIHGAADEVFPLDRARQSHAQVLKKGFEGRFHEIPKLNHVASTAVGDIVVDRIRTYL